jgi:phenylacetate-CoA ligase
MAGIKERVYNLLPFELQNLAISWFGFFWRKRRFGGIFEKELEQYLLRDKYTAIQWENYQNDKLREVLLWAFDTVPYYRNSFREAGLSRLDLEGLTIHNMDRIPVLSKQDLRNFCKTTLISEKPEQGGEFFATSGSTGTPSSILYSPDMHQRWSAAFECRGRYWAGVSRFHSRGMIGGRRVVTEGIDKGPYYRYNHFEKHVYFSAYHISSNTAKQYAEAFPKYNIDYMTGYAMSNYFLAKHFKESNIKVGPLKAVITSSEKLTDEMRTIFQEVYGCKTFDSYGSVEACSLITECEHGKLHISPDIGLIEVINEQGIPCKPGETGEIYATSFINFDQPLIRYKIADLITLSEQQVCKCGREMPIVKEIAGRLEDTIVGADGRQIVRFHGIFVNINEIVEGQIIQNTFTDYEVNVVVSKLLTEKGRDIIISRMKSQLGEANISVNTVDSIPRTANGKFKAVVSKIQS